MEHWKILKVVGLLTEIFTFLDLPFTFDWTWQGQYTDSSSKIQIGTKGQGLTATAKSFLNTGGSHLKKTRHDTTRMSNLVSQPSGQH